MTESLRPALRKLFKKLVTSIAFYPALIGASFLMLSYASLRFDFSATGQQLKASLSWLSLKDATTARSIISSIVAGIISLTVFSFSMVMIVLNQAASQLSNRVLDKLIGNRFQQVVLGIYIGTIVYALFLLSTIRDVDSGLTIPALSTYLLIVLTILDIFIFIYFLHYITQSVKFEVIIGRIRQKTMAQLKRDCYLPQEDSAPATPDLPFFLNTRECGVYESFDRKALVGACEKFQCSVAILVPPGTFLLQGGQLAGISRLLSEEQERELLSAFSINQKESLEENAFYGFRQLMEVAVKALSPGINDPDTAVISLRSLFELYAYRMVRFPQLVFRNEEGALKVQRTMPCFEETFNSTLLPVWDYGKEDRIIRRELAGLLAQLNRVQFHEATEKLLTMVNQKREKCGD